MGEDNLKRMRASLKRWAYTKRITNRELKDKLLYDIDMLEKKEHADLSQQKQAVGKAIEQSLNDIYEKEDLYWRQKSRIFWLKEGNRNTAFFQKMASGRKKK